ncbi:MAG: hypothetical protein ACRCWR_02900 [Saezia sp.]
MHVIRRETFSLVFEPVVDMLNDEIVGYEGLCRCANPRISAEIFFKQLSTQEHLELLSRQLQKYQKWVEQHPERYQARALFLNINQALLLESDLPGLFVPYNNYYPIHIELELMWPLTCAHRAAIENIVDNQGMQLWFDDYIGGRLPVARDVWNGIKLDKYYFWSLINHKERLLGLGDPFTAADVICEGVETTLQKRAALALGLRYGQGYLWPAVG